MAKKVGFLCPLKTEWLNKTVALVNEGMATANIRDALSDYISFEIKSPDNIRKTREMLMHLWVYPFEDEKANQIRKQALQIIKNGVDDQTVFHWCMLLMYYPVFSDVAGIIGKMLTMQESFSLAWLKGKMAEEWGERSTLLRSVEKVMQTMRQLKVVTSNQGIYAANKTTISGDIEIKTILKTILSLNLQAYYEPSELANVPQMFPFDYTVEPELIYGNQDFEIGNFGGNPVVIG